MTPTFTLDARGMTINLGRRWTAELDEELRRRVAAHQTAGQIAREMGRTLDAIRGRADTLRITVRSSVRPWRDGVTRRSPAID